MTRKFLTCQQDTLVWDEIRLFVWEPGRFPRIFSQETCFECLLLLLLISVCAAPPNHEHALTAPASLVTAELSPVSSTVHSAAAALFARLSTGSTAAPPSIAPLQRATPLITPSGKSTVPQLQPDSATVPAPPLPIPSSCLSTSNPPDTVLSDAASALFAHVSVVAPALAPVETALEDEPAPRRQNELPGEDDMMIAGSSLPGKPESSPAPLPYMTHKLRAQLAFWKSLRAPRQVLNWIEFSFMGVFHSECPRIRKPNQESCDESVEQFEFVDSSVSQLLDRGVIGIWNPDWGEPVVISPLKVVPKKGRLYI